MKLKFLSPSNHKSYPPTVRFDKRGYLSLSVETVRLLELSDGRRVDVGSFGNHIYLVSNPKGQFKVSYPPVCMIRKLKNHFIEYGYELENKYSIEVVENQEFKTLKINKHKL